VLLQHVTTTVQYPATGTDRCFPVTVRLDYCNSVLVGLPANLIRRLQSVPVQNAAARHFGIRRSEHITDALASLRWLRVPDRTLFKVAVLTYRAVNGSVPAHLSSYFTSVADVPSRLRLRSSNSDQLHSAVLQLHYGRQAGLPSLRRQSFAHLTSAPSLTIFRQRLKAFFFRLNHSELTSYRGSSSNYVTVFINILGYITNPVA